MFVCVPEHICCSFPRQHGSEEITRVMSQVMTLPVS